ncbi:MAG: hypothetical protein AAFR17_14465 [Pseudomonadota bacterium]
MTPDQVTELMRGGLSHSARLVRQAAPSVEATHPGHLASNKAAETAVLVTAHARQLSADIQAAAPSADGTALGRVASPVSAVRDRA